MTPSHGNDMQYETTIPRTRVGLSNSSNDVSASGIIENAANPAYDIFDNSFRDDDLLADVSFSDSSDFLAALFDIPTTPSGSNVAIGGQYISPTELVPDVDFFAQMDDCFDMDLPYNLNTFKTLSSDEYFNFQTSPTEGFGRENRAPLDDPCLGSSGHSAGHDDGGWNEVSMVNCSALGYNELGFDGVGSPRKSYSVDKL